MTGIYDIIRLYKNIAAVLNAMGVLSVPLSVMDGANGLSGWDSVSGSGSLNGISSVNGSNGVNGVGGLNGMSGLSISSGLNGLNGMSGSVGAIGRSGTNGLRGPDGLNGSNGLRKSNGANVLSGVNGLNGWNGFDSLNGKVGSVGTNSQSGYNGFGVIGSVGGYRLDSFPFNNLTEMRSGGFSALQNTSMKTIDQERIEQLHRITSNSQNVGGGSEIRVDMSGMRNIVNNRSDIDELIDRLSVQLCEAALSMGEGVHY